MSSYPLKENLPPEGRESDPLSPRPTNENRQPKNEGLGAIFKTSFFSLIEFYSFCSTESL